VRLRQAFSELRTRLAAAGMEDASLEAELLLRHTLEMSRVQLYLELDRELGREERRSLGQLAQRRLSGEPAAYITGHREFFGLDFYVDARVLIPRPETELLAEEAIRLARRHDIKSIAEIGTGCGAVAVSLALNLPGIAVYATDISPEALEVARLNCRRHGVEGDIRLLEGDMLASLPAPVDLVVANLPYVREGELVGAGVSHEPRLALDGGGEGLDKIYRLCRQVAAGPGKPGHLLLEIGQGQSEAVSAYLRRLFPLAGVTSSRDLGGIERVVRLYREMPVSQAALN